MTNPPGCFCDHDKVMATPVGRRTGRAPGRSTRPSLDKGRTKNNPSSPMGAFRKTDSDLDRPPTLDWHIPDMPRSGACQYRAGRIRQTPLYGVSGGRTGVKRDSGMVAATCGQRGVEGRFRAFGGYCRIAIRYGMAGSVSRSAAGLPACRHDLAPIAKTGRSVRHALALLP